MQESLPPRPPQPQPQLPGPQNSFIRRHILSILMLPIGVALSFGWYRLQFNPDLGPELHLRPNIKVFGYTLVDYSAYKVKRELENPEAKFENIDSEDQE